MNKILSQKVSHETVMLVLAVFVVISGIFVVRHYKSRMENSDKIAKTIIVEALKEGVNKDSLKDALVRSDTLK